MPAEVESMFYMKQQVLYNVAEKSGYWQNSLKSTTLLVMK